MTDDKIAEIRARHNYTEEMWWAAEDPCANQAHADRATLLAEAERLRAEVEKLREALTEISQYETFAPAGFEWDIVVEELVEIARKALEAKL